MAIDGWRIDDQGVVSILAALDEPTQTVSDVARRMSSQDATGASSEVVGGAVAEFFRQRQPGIESVANRMAAIGDATSAALGAYIRGDEEMASDTQALAA